jgi:hypothetical protein
MSTLSSVSHESTRPLLQCIILGWSWVSGLVSSSRQGNISAWSRRSWWKDLKTCALNTEFQHFILRFDKNFLTLRIPLEEEGLGDERRPKDLVKTGLLTLQITLLCKRFGSFWCFGKAQGGGWGHRHILVTPSSNGLSMHNELWALKKCKIRSCQDSIMWIEKCPT